jgi:hypothetical protein
MERGLALLGVLDAGLAALVEELLQAASVMAPCVVEDVTGLLGAFGGYAGLEGVVNWRRHGFDIWWGRY